MASSNLRFMFNSTSKILYRSCNPIIFPQRFSQRNLVSFNKLALLKSNNSIQSIQKRYETTDSQPKPKPDPKTTTESSSTPTTDKKIVEQKSSSSFKSFSKLVVVFISGVVAYYGITIYLDFLDDKADTSEKALQYKPGIIKKVSKKIDRGAENPGGLKLTLYQYATCPFCCKVRAYLDYYGYNYDIVEVNSIFRQQLKWSPYKKVPILAVQQPVSCDLKTKQMVYDGDFVQLNDSSVIISALETFRQNPSVSMKEIVSYYEPIVTKDSRGKQVYEHPNKYFIMLQDKRPSSAQALNNIKDEREWRQWVDTKFVHVISPNVYRTFRESINAFQWFDKTGDWEQNFNPFERYAAQYIGAFVMYLIGKN